MASQLDETLREEDLHVLIVNIWEVRSKWYSLGLILGISARHLDEIQHNSNNTDDYFIQTLKDWLRACLTPTWGTLIEALKSPVLGYNLIAHRLAAKFGPQDAASCTRASEASKTPSSSRLGERPTLSQLSALKTPTGHIVRIIKALTPNWKIVGDLLEFDDMGKQLILIEKDNRGNPETCCRDMFQLWLMGQGKQPCSWGTLVEILRDGDMSFLASEIEAAL